MQINVPNKHYAILCINITNIGNNDLDGGIFMENISHEDIVKVMGKYGFDGERIAFVQIPIWWQDTIKSELNRGEDNELEHNGHT